MPSSQRIRGYTAGVVFPQKKERGVSQGYQVRTNGRSIVALVWEGHESRPWRICAITSMQVYCPLDGFIRVEELFLVAWIGFTRS